MLKISRLTDYGLLAAVYLARRRGAVVSSREIAEFYRLPNPMITKVLKTLQHGGLVQSHRGVGTDIEADQAPPGLDEDIIRLISAKKEEPQWLLDWRLKSFRHWLTMKEPAWANVKYGPIDYQAIRYYSAPKQKKSLTSLDEVDPELRRTFEKLGISLEEQKRLSGVAVDAVFDSVSVATTFRAELAKVGIIFCLFSEALQIHPALLR